MEQIFKQIIKECVAFEELR